MELFHRGEWGTICDDDFSISNANVLCRQLGFVSATGWTHSAKYGKGQGETPGDTWYRLGEGSRSRPEEIDGAVQKREAGPGQKRICSPDQERVGGPNLKGRGWSIGEGC